MNNNGLISFGRSVGSFIPTVVPKPDDRQLIAPFWADVDTNNRSFEINNTVWYRETSDPALLNKAVQQIQMAFINHPNFLPTFLFIATWDEVRHFGGNTYTVRLSIPVCTMHNYPVCAHAQQGRVVGL